LKKIPFCFPLDHSSICEHFLQAIHFQIKSFKGFEQENGDAILHSAYSSFL
jgi:hypothetical protein